MTVREIVEAYLREHGLDGLTYPPVACACKVGDLIPCNEECVQFCEAGKIGPCPGEECEYFGEAHYHMEPVKP
jgi:hypothetical protein